jgi:hypothetical protein
MASLAVITDCGTRLHRDRRVFESGFAPDSHSLGLEQRLQNNGQENDRFPDEV